MKNDPNIYSDAVADFYIELNSITRTLRREISPYISRNSTENSIWLHDCGRFGSSFIDYALYLSTLTLLYDRIYWFNPCNVGIL